MPDYNLSGLSARSFEQLIQAESNSSRSRSASATIWSNSGCFIMLR
jgi:hypothetical protein